MVLDNVRFGVLGTGRITRRIVAELQQATGVRVTGIASRDGFDPTGSSGPGVAMRGLPTPFIEP